MTILLSDRTASAAPDPPAASTLSASPTVTVDLAAVAANVRVLRGRTTGEIMAVVKADGFGHGMAGVAATALAAGATRLGVATIEEALDLRKAGFDCRILSWLNPVDADYALALSWGVELAIPSRAHLAAVVRTGLPARLHLQLDTGMARDGAAPEEWAALCRAARIAELSGPVAVVGVMGHLACAAQSEHPAEELGRRRFSRGVRVARAAGLRPADRHLAATAATLTDPRSHHTMSRVGAGLVGIDESRTGRLRPAMTLTAPVAELRQVRAGTGVGYGHTWTASRATRLALLPLGYADGLPRAASDRAEVLVAGVRRPIVGRISMDMTVVDLGPDEAMCPARLGDIVTVFGPGDDGEPTVAEWAVWADTLDHEIVTGLGNRLRRVTRGA